MENCPPLQSWSPFHQIWCGVQAVGGQSSAFSTITAAIKYYTAWWKAALWYDCAACPQIPNIFQVTILFFKLGFCSKSGNLKIWETIINRHPKSANTHASNNSSGVELYNMGISPHYHFKRIRNRNDRGQRVKCASYFCFRPSLG